MGRDSNSDMGDKVTVRKFDRDQRMRCFSVWKAWRRASEFGRPAAFISISTNNWISLLPDNYGRPTFLILSREAGTSGHCGHHDRRFKLEDQLRPVQTSTSPTACDVNVLCYGQCTGLPVTYQNDARVHGPEMFAELLYHCGLRTRRRAFFASNCRRA